MLDFIGMVITAALMVLVVNALTAFTDVTRVAKITLAAVIGVWIGLAAAVAGRRVAHDLETAPGGRTLRGGAASRGGVRNRMADRAQGGAEHTVVSDGRTQYRTHLCRAFSYAGGRGAAHGAVFLQRRLGRHHHGRRRRAGAVAPEGRGRAPHHSRRGLEFIGCRSRAGNRLRHHVGRGFALATFPWPGLGSDAASALVVRSEGTGPDLTDPARDYRCAIGARAKLGQTVSVVA
jgi:hypothetical protein